jgi:Activator of 2-hydroxyglutaryl-CoA dehydratase (HSP70-class ATPase domain)
MQAVPVIWATGVPSLWNLTLFPTSKRGPIKIQLIAGLSYSIVENYLNKVVLGKPVGEHILFQGGVALNRAVVSAFESILNKKIIIPEHNEVTGAIGSALLAF